MSFPERAELRGVPAGMAAEDAELLRAADAVLEDAYREGVHEVAAAMRLGDGAVVLGLHVEAGASRASVCAEAVALSAAIIAGSAVSAVVAVLRRPGGSRHLIEPCGVCAELLADHAPSARVWVAAGGGAEAVTPAQLLPYRRRRSARVADGAAA